MDATQQPNPEFPMNHEVFGLMQARIQQTQNSVGPLFLVDDYGVCTQNKTIALQPRITSALVDTRKKGSGTTESTILCLSESQSEWCLGSDFRQLPPICTAHGENMAQYPL